MRIRGFSLLRFLGVVAFILLPGVAAAQSTIAGLVTDATGAVLPGVTVEASSPALIEKVRTASTDGQGRYSIVDLRPGVYAVTFTLPGFSTVRRDGIEVASNTNVPINAEMNVGAVEETITVSGQTPVVDVQTTARRQVLNRDTLDALPTSRNFQQIGSLVPGVKMSAPDVGSSNSMNMTTLSAHGLVAKETTYLVDGMDMRSMSSDGTVQYYPNNAMTQEFNYQTSSIGADTQGGGIRLNMIPREGGNRFSVWGYGGGTPKSWISDNTTQEMRDAGFTSGDSAEFIYEVNGAVGGPILRDRLWFFGSVRWQAVDQIVADTFFAPTPITPANWWQPATWTDGEPGISDQWIRNQSVRVTGKLGNPNKFTVYYDRTDKAQWHDMVAGDDPDTSTRVTNPDNLNYYNAQAKFTSTLTNRLLLETGYSTTLEVRTSEYQTGTCPGCEVSFYESTPRFSPQWFASAAHQDLVTGRRWKAAPQGTRGVYPYRYTYSTHVSYVTGSHAVKGGVQLGWGNERNDNDSLADLVQLYRSGVPDSVRVFNTPTSADDAMNRDFGAYVQDAWTIRRLTANIGVRMDHFVSSMRPTSLPAGRFAPARTFAGQENLPNWTNFSPRLGVAYDLFGNAKTALKASFGRYMETWGTGFAARYNPMRMASEVREWDDLNGDDIAQDNEIGDSPNALFGQPRASRRLGPGVERGFNTEWTVGVQHEVMTGLSAHGTWYRRGLFNLERQDNVLTTLDDWTPVQIVSPLDGEVITVYNLHADKFGAVDLVDTMSTNSDLRRNTYNGFEFGASGRLRNGGTFFGGWTFERTINVNCDSTSDPNTFRFCDQSQLDIPFRHEFKLAGTYPLPFQLQASAALVSWPGAPLGVNWSISRTTNYAAGCAAPCTPAARVIPGLTPATLNVPLVAPGERYNDRWNQLDLGIRRTLNFGAKSVMIDLQAFNALNTAAIRDRNQTFGTSLGRPTATLEGRVIRLTAQFKM